MDIRGHIIKNLKYPVITYDGGASNGYRNKLWKLEIQRLANKIGAKFI